MQANQYLTFDRYTLDLPNAQLWREKRQIVVASKAFAVLRYLLEHAGQLVTKAEVFAALWPGTVVSDGALTVCVVELRKALGDNAKRPKFIETVHGRGYRFIGKGGKSQQSVGNSPTFPTQSSVLSPWPSVLVGRERELVQLHAYLEKAVSGERQLVFVTGEPGIGKTTLLEKFLFGVRSYEKFRVRASALPPPNSALSSTSEVWVVQGQCIEHYGPGEPYLPILEALTRLCRMPEGQHVVTLLRQYAPTWLVQMPSLLSAPELDALQRTTQGATRERMLREMGEAMEVITAERPLLLVLEDLHWSDASTVELLSLLARRRESACFLVIATYRPIDVIVQEHPLRMVKHELQLHHLCEELSLGLLSETSVAEYLTTRFLVSSSISAREGQGGGLPTAVVQNWARLIHQRTDGNPLFMVTAVDDLVAQDALVSDNDQGPLSDDLTAVTMRVPDTVQQLIERQLDRLSPEDRQLLEVASVAGMEFSAAAVAAGAELGLEQVEGRCAGLAQHARFLRTSGATEWPDGTVAAQYSFLHALYQEVLYTHIPAGRRQRLHHRIGERQEAAYGERAREIATELAVHFEQGRDYGKAVQYLQQAGDNAVRRSASVEAVRHLTKGLETLTRLPATRERAQQELSLQLALGVPLQAAKSHTAPEVERVYTRARELCRQIGETPQLFPALWGLWVFYLVRAELEMAHELGEQLLSMAQSVQDPAFFLQAHYALGVNLAYRGKYALAREHFEQSPALYDLQRRHLQTFRYGNFDPKVVALSWTALVLWALGYPDQALKRSQEALVFAQDLSHLGSLAVALDWAAWFHLYRREEQISQDRAEAAIVLSTDHGFAQWLAIATVFGGKALVEQGQKAEGIAQIRQGIATHQAIGGGVTLPYFLTLLAEAYGQGGQGEERFATLTEALTRVDKTGERQAEAEIYRLKGELTLQQFKVQGSKFKVEKSLESRVRSSEFDAEECFLKAIAIARKRQAKSLELRVSTSLARLWQGQDKKAEAHKLLSEIYNWFTEGFETKDLQEAKALLESLESVGIVRNIAMRQSGD